MSVIRVTTEDTVEIDNGLAYGLIAGGATGYLEPIYRWYVGHNYTTYMMVLFVQGVPLWLIASLLAIRAALGGAIKDARDDVAVLADGNAIRLIKAETMDDNELTKFMDSNLAVYKDWHFDGKNYPKIPKGVKDSLVDPTFQRWVDQCARMTYTILAINGFGLITASHHLRTQAEKAAEATIKMYELEKIAKVVGADSKMTLSGIFHHALHPVEYERVAIWANNLGTGAIAKVAATIVKRLPAYPGGTTFVQRAMTCITHLSAVAAYKELMEKIKGATDTLKVLDSSIRTNPLDYSQQFRPVQYELHRTELGEAAKIAAIIFGLYDAWINKPKSEDGPTKGQGMLNLIEEHMATYKNAFETGRTLCDAQPAMTVDDLVKVILAIGETVEKSHVAPTAVPKPDPKGKDKAADTVNKNL